MQRIPCGDCIWLQLQLQAVAAVALLACFCCAVDAAPSGSSEQRVALSAAMASQRRANTTAGNGRHQAVAAGIPINTAFLAAHPEVRPPKSALLLSLRAAGSLTEGRG